MPEAALMGGLEALLTGIVDYAGLFPPAKLDMAPVVRNYAEYIESDRAWMLGRLIVPVARLEEFEHAAADALPTVDGAQPWMISALGGDDLDADLRAIDDFNRRHANAAEGLAIIDTLETRAETTSHVDQILRRLGDSLTAFVEIPIADDPRGLIASLAAEGVAAKVRTGGVTESAFPTVETLARFVLYCAAANVPFKATAGLHHPIRAPHRLTYEPDSESGVMHGFLNVFLCAAFARGAVLTDAEAREILNETDPHAFQFEESGVTWRDRRLTIDQITKTRQKFAASFGSCSFEEPADDLAALGLLPG